jgi:hypothetical protein
LAWLWRLFSSVFLLHLSLVHGFWAAVIVHSIHQMIGSSVQWMKP